MNKLLVIYHAHCADGYGAAWSAWKKFGDTADYKPVVYGEEPPDTGAYDEIYILDFSYPVHTLIGMKKYEEEHYADGTGIRREFNKVVVIDHHRTAEEMLKGYPDAIFDMTHSGAYLAWRYFHPDKDVPKLILAIEDRDLWLWKLPYSREISAALASYPMRFDVWSNIAVRLDDEENYPLRDFVSEGAAILRYQRQNVEAIANQARMVNIASYNIPQVNATSNWSEVCEELIRLYPEAPFVACWHELGDAKIKYSLRSKGEFDVSKIAQQFGGGGHKNAAGFTI